MRESNGGLGESAMHVDDLVRRHARDVLASIRTLPLLAASVRDRPQRRGFAGPLNRSA